MARGTKSPDEKRGCPPGAGTIELATGGTIGNPPFVATEEQRQQVIDEVVFYGQKALAVRMGIHVDTLGKHFRAEIDAAVSNKVAEAAHKLFEKVMAGDGACIRFFLMTVGKGQWSPKQTHEHTGPAGAPIAIDISGFLKGKSDEELARIESILVELATAGGVAIPGGSAVGDPASPAAKG